ncbi:hypothetical protein LMG19282_04856 [Cupriavidus campinensis]|uniref:DUF6527 family protein n=1 Tax=Cupriavidus campinensis TaxID=151783 RepID=UPI001B15F3FE|nr:DUF6527 family protein [Cupriavidus campinensis]CAG2155212.1 hypothetical protein LMG19282_04856 [Cupriavidus campinensis]
MTHLSKVLREAAPGHLTFWCPGCKDSHSIRYGDGSGPRWGWNGNAERPTFTPSVLVRSGHYVPGHENGSCWCTYYAEHPDEPGDFACAICHTFVTEGNIQFLGDCTHEFAGKTVPMVEFPEGRAC